MPAKRPALTGLTIQRRDDQAPPPGESPFALSTTVSPDAILLPPEAADLDPEAQASARRFLTFRRRTGEALEGAARELYQQRARLKPLGQWHLYLRVVNCGQDVAERLCNIYERGQQIAAFAEKVRAGFFNQSVAAILARESTPPEALNWALALPEPPEVDEVLNHLNPERPARKAGKAAQSPKAGAPPPTEPQANLVMSGVGASPNVEVPRGNGAAELATAPFERATVIAPLGAQTRSQIAQLTEQIRGYTAQPTTLSGDDWNALTGLLDALRELEAALQGQPFMA
jgi:hypothetical protein